MVFVPSGLVVKLDQEKSESWMLDSAYTMHNPSRRDYFHTFCECNDTIQVGNNEFMQSIGSESVTIETVVDNVTHNIALNDVIYAPKLYIISFRCRKYDENNFKWQ